MSRILSRHLRNWLILFAVGAAAGGFLSLAVAQPARDAPAPSVSEEATVTPGAEAAAPSRAPGKVEGIPERASELDTSLVDRAISLLGLVVLIGIAWLCSWNRKAVDWKLVGWGVGLQFAFGVLILQTNFGRWIFDQLKVFFNKILSFTDEGASFLFGAAADVNGPLGMVFAFKILPTIIFFSSLMAVLYHVGAVQPVVKWMALIMQKTMGTSGAESLSAAANVFVGQTEAPLVVKPYVERMTMSELAALMCGGMATVAGGVLAAYVSMGISAGHLLSASVMSAPAALLMAKILLPETEESKTAGGAEMRVESLDANLIDAAARGAGEGLTLAMNVGGMLLAFIALIAMVNYGFELANGWVDGWLLPALGFEGVQVFPDSLETALGYLMAPVAWVMGVPWQDCVAIGQLLGVKTVLNEFVAYDMLGRMLREGNLHPRSIVIATYALCGFANFSSIAIQLGGIGGMAPTRKHDLARLGILALIGGTLAAFMTATVAGVLA